MHPIANAMFIFEYQNIIVRLHSSSEIGSHHVTWFSWELIGACYKCSGSVHLCTCSKWPDVKTLRFRDAVGVETTIVNTASNKADFFYRLIVTTIP